MYKKVANSNIKVKVSAIPKEDMKFNLPKDTTIRALKELIAEKEHFKSPTVNWKLVHAGRHLNDRETLEDIHNEAAKTSRNYKEGKIILHIYWIQLFKRTPEGYSEEQTAIKYYKECAYEIM